MAYPKNKTVVILAGPTAVGKTALAISLAQYFNAEIISADSRQCFKELNIGVARPSVEELQTVPHHFIASHTIAADVTAASFEAWALEKTAALFQNNDVVIMTGGTGLYIKAFCEGLDAIPVVDAAIRSSITAAYEKQGIEWLQKEIEQKDPLFFTQGEIKNPQRMMRALEVIEATGLSILSYRSSHTKQRPFQIIKTALELPRQQLNHNIDIRVDKMIAAGLVAEVQELLPYRTSNALQTVGYTEIFDMLDGKTSIQEATALIKTHTRQYAKRQMTWFKKDKDIRWFSPQEYDRLITEIQAIR